MEEYCFKCDDTTLCRRIIFHLSLYIRMQLINALNTQNCIVVFRKY